MDYKMNLMLTTLITVFCTYCLGTLVFWKPDPAGWPALGRAILVVFFFLSTAAFISVDVRSRRKLANRNADTVVKNAEKMSSKSEAR